MHPGGLVKSMSGNPVPAGPGSTGPAGAAAGAQPVGATQQGELFLWAVPNTTAGWSAPGPGDKGPIKHVATGLCIDGSSTTSQGDFFAMVNCSGAATQVQPWGGQHVTARLGFRYYYWVAKSKFD